MQKRGFSVTTVVLVAVLISALFMVSKSVTQPPPGPPEPPKAAQGNLAQPAKSPEQQKKEMQEQHQAMMDRMRKQHPMPAKGSKVVPPVKKFDPNTIEVSPAYFGQASMGSNGEAQMEIKVAKAKAEIAAEQAKRKAQQPANGAAPPSSVPGSSAPAIPNK